MDFWAILFDIGTILAVALALGALCERLRQSALLGYLLAGALLGPNAFDVVSNREEIEGLAEVGASLLLFSIGLEFSWLRLRSTGPAALGGGSLQVVVTIAIFSGAAAMFGVPLRTALVVGSAFAISSTAGVLRVLMARAELDSVHGRHALGMLLFQDLAVIPLVLLASFLADPGTGASAVWKLGRTALLLILTVAAFYVVFNHLAPRLILVAARLRNRELPVLFAVVAALASIWGAHKMGLSPALGAFIAGMLLAGSPYATQVRADLAVLRTLLVTVFFSSVGMLCDLGWMFSNAGLIGMIVGGVIITKALVIWLILRFLRQPASSSLAAGICLAQIGEFAFVIAGSAGAALITEDLFKIIASTMMVTLFLTPYLVTGSRAISAVVLRTLLRLGLVRDLAPSPMTEPGELVGHVILIGYGPAGEAVGEALKRNGSLTTVIDLNPQLVRKANESGFDAHVGDATHVDILDHVYVASACAIAITVPDPQTAQRIVRVARSRTPNAPIVARARYHKYRRDIELAGASVVVDEEQNVGASMGDRLLGSEASANLGGG